ncbi:MAG: hypothetical protein V7782_11840 [Psychromonas sp.]
MLKKLIISMVSLAIIVATLTTGLISATLTLLAFFLLFYYVINSNRYEKAEN